jgi:hypothetical protein
VRLSSGLVFESVEDCKGLLVEASCEPNNGRRFGDSKAACAGEEGCDLLFLARLGFQLTRSGSLAILLYGRIAGFKKHPPN